MPPLIEPVVAARRPALADQPVIRVDAVNALLRQWRRGDASQLKAAFADKQIRQWNLYGLSSIRESHHWIEQWGVRWRKGTGASWAIVDSKTPGVVLGQMAFRSLYLADGLAELSCWVMPNARHRHVATEATRALTEWAFGTLGLVRLEIVHSTQNPSSCSVALRAGFRKEGVLRHLQRHADGFHDMCLHSRIQKDDGRPIVPPPVPAPDELAARRRRRRLGDFSRSVLKRPEKVAGAGVVAGS